MIHIFVPQNSFAQVIPNYTNSWLGNTFGTPAKHIPHSIDNMYVTPSGKVAIITGWDEGGHNVVLFDNNGIQIGVPVESGTGSWGRNSGNAVFVDDKYIYQLMSQEGCDGNNNNPNHYPICGNQWFCVRRYFHNGNSAPFDNGKGYDSSFLIVNSNTTKSSGGLLNGIVVLNNELYVSDKQKKTIKVYNATTMNPTMLRELTVGNNGLLDYDSQGNIWCLDVTEQKLIRFLPSGTLLSQQVIFPANIKATSFCIDKVNNRILVTNNGIDQNIVIYTNIFSNPVQTATFGLTGGINSGVMGEVSPLKFSEPKGVGIDNIGNIYVGNNGVLQGGGRLEKYNLSGKMEWRLNGLIFTDNGTVDPTSETDFYSKEFHLQLNLNNSMPGSEWKLKGMTINRFAFPEDDRSSNNIFWTTTYVRNILGKRILYVSDMYGKNLLAYKFDSIQYGQVAIPSIYFGYNSDTNKEFIWTDGNNDKLHQANEYDNKPPTNIYSFHIVPDLKGNIWKTNREDGIRYFPLQGLDMYGNPKYAFANSTLFPNPNGIKDIFRIDYDTLTGDLYVSGRENVDELWWCAGNKLAKYTNFLANPNANPTWIIDLPYFRNSPASDENVKAFCVAGDYVFTLLAKKGKIIVREKATGKVVGDILPTSSTDFRSGWADINGAIQAHKLPNGEYLIFAEENGNAKIMMYRWCPVGSCSTLSVEENVGNTKNIVYPNPTNDAIFINLKEKETIKLFNASGQLIYSKQDAFGIEKIEMKSLPNGLYFLKTTKTTYKIIRN